jgi:predicted metal-binding membrane protein
VREGTVLESVLRREGWPVLGALAAITGLCWAWIVPMSRDMYGPMTGPAAWMMAPSADARYGVLLFAMWSAMMVGMMLPSAAPTLLLYLNVMRKSTDVQDAARRAYLLAAGYLCIWGLFSLAATLLQRALSARFLLSPMMVLQGRALSGGVLLVAGLFQLTPLKRGCLTACRSPAEFLVRHWQPGAVGAFRLGLRHGWHCVGCCWALMLLLFAGGIMNLGVIIALTTLVLFEKLAPVGSGAGRLTGGVLAAIGIWNLVS